MNLAMPPEAEAEKRTTYETVVFKCRPASRSPAALRPDAPRHGITCGVMA